jgi:hypothetical protein
MKKNIPKLLLVCLVIASLLFSRTKIFANAPSGSAATAAVSDAIEATNEATAVGNTVTGLVSENQAFGFSAPVTDEVSAPTIDVPAMSALEAAQQANQGLIDAMSALQGAIAAQQEAATIANGVVDSPAAPAAAPSVDAPPAPSAELSDIPSADAPTGSVPEGSVPDNNNDNTNQGTIDEGNNSSTNTNNSGTVDDNTNEGSDAPSGSNSGSDSSSPDGSGPSSDDGSSADV